MFFYRFDLANMTWELSNKMKKVSLPIKIKIYNTFQKYTSSTAYGDLSKLEEVQLLQRPVFNLFKMYMKF